MKVITKTDNTGKGEESYATSKTRCLPLGKIQGPPAHLNLANPSPVRGPSYRYPEKAKPIIVDLLKDMEERDIIEPSTAAWLSPIVLINKPDGSKKMCLDYRGVNKHLAVDIYPLPRLEELVEFVLGNIFYATLDHKDAYFQVMLDENSRDVTTFSVKVSLYRFKRLPFGLSCSPAILFTPDGPNAGSFD